jgi:hypothetical protein
MIYLAASPLSPGLAGELNLGIILNTAYRGKGYAREAIGLVLKHAFDDKHCHRIQVSLLNLSSKDRMLSLLTQLYVPPTLIGLILISRLSQAIRPRRHKAALVLQPHVGGVARRDNTCHSRHRLGDAQVLQTCPQITLGRAIFTPRAGA